MDVWRIIIFYDNNYQDLQVTPAYIIGKTWDKDHHPLGNGLNHRQSSFMTDCWCDHSSRWKYLVEEQQQDLEERRDGGVRLWDCERAGVRLVGLSTCDKYCYGDGLQSGLSLLSPPCTPLTLTLTYYVPLAVQYVIRQPVSLLTQSQIKTPSCKH